MIWAIKFLFFTVCILYYIVNVFCTCIHTYWLTNTVEQRAQFVGSRTPPNPYAPVLSGADGFLTQSTNVMNKLLNALLLHYPHLVQFPLKII